MIEISMDLNNGDKKTNPKPKGRKLGGGAWRGLPRVVFSGVGK